MNQTIHILKKVAAGICQPEEFIDYLQSLSVAEQDTALYWLSASLFSQNKSIFIRGLLHERLYEKLDLLEGPFRQIHGAFNLGWGIAYKVSPNSFQNKNPKLFFINSSAWVPQEEDSDQNWNWQYEAAKERAWCLEHYSSGFSDFKIETLMFDLYGDGKEKPYYTITFRFNTDACRDEIQLPEDVYHANRDYVLGILDLRIDKDSWIGECTKDGLVVLNHISI